MLMHSTKGASESLGPFGSFSLHKEQFDFPWREIENIKEKTKILNII